MDDVELSNVGRKVVSLEEVNNINLALVLPSEHPPHIAFIDHNIKEGVTHRDGSKAKYEDDGFGNIIEKIKYER